MKKIAILFMLITAGCAATIDATSEMGQDFQDCNPIICGGGGGPGGGGGGNSCSTINCSQNWQCQQACLNFQAECLVLGNGPYVTGSCLNWGSPNP